MKKRIVLLLSVGLMAAWLWGCGGQEAEECGREYSEKVFHFSAASVNASRACVGAPPSNAPILYPPLYPAGASGSQ